MGLFSGLASAIVLLHALEIGVGVLFLAGLWTPVAGALAALVECGLVLSHQGDPLAYILLGTIGAALGLLGPGAWSVDARLFGWKRIDIRDRRR